MVRIEPPVYAQGCTCTLAVPQHGGHVGEPQAPLDVAIGISREVDPTLAIHGPLDIHRVWRCRPGDDPLDEVVQHGLEDRSKAYGVLPRRAKQPRINHIRGNVGDPGELVLPIAGGLVSGSDSP